MAKIYILKPCKWAGKHPADPPFRFEKVGYAEVPQWLADRMLETEFAAEKAPKGGRASAAGAAGADADAGKQGAGDGGNSGG